MTAASTAITTITTDTIIIKCTERPSSFEEGSFVFADAVYNLGKNISFYGISPIDKRHNMWQDIVGVKIPGHKILCQNINKP